MFKKQLEGTERELYEKRKRLKTAIDAGRNIPSDLLKEQEELRERMPYDDPAKFEQSIDDEYARAGIRDPKLVITTSRDPSSRLNQFVKELRLVFPNAQKLNRGNYVLKQLVETCRANEVTDLVLVHEHRGEPDGLVVCHLPYGPTAYFGIMNAVLRHDLKERSTVSQQFPHLIFHKFDSKLGERTMKVLKHLFPVPKEDAHRVITFANENDFISFRHHTYKKEGHKNVELTEVGPRFELKLYQIKLGTVDMTEADNEWVLKPFMSNAKRKQNLSVAVRTAPPPPFH